MHHEVLIFLKSFWYGAFLVLVYDLFRIHRILKKHSTVVIAVQDLFFWTFCGFYLFVMCYRDNSGALRLYPAAAIAAGALACKCSISPCFVSAAVFLGRKIQVICRIPMKFIQKTIKRLKFCVIGVTISLCRKIDRICGRDNLSLSNKGKSHEEKKKRKKNAYKKK